MEQQTEIEVLSSQLESNRHMKNEKEKVAFTAAYHNLVSALRNNPKELTHHVCKGLVDVSGSYEKTSWLSETIKYAHEHREVVYRQFVAEMPTMKEYGRNWIVQLLFWIINSAARFNGFKDALTDLTEEEKITLLEMIEDMRTYPIRNHQQQSLEEIEGVIFGGMDINLSELEAILIANREGRSEQQQHDFEQACIQIFAHAPKNEETVAVLFKGLSDQQPFQNYLIFEHLKGFNARQIYSVFIEEMSSMKAYAQTSMFELFERIVSKQDHVDLFVDLAKTQEKDTKKNLQTFIQEAIQYFEKRVNHKLNQRNVAAKLKQLNILI